MKRLGSIRMYLLVAVTILSFGYLTAAAEAAPIEYQFMGTGVSGGLDILEFNNANFNISIFGDTNNVTTDSFGSIITGLTGTMNLFGGDLLSPQTGSFLDPLYVFVDPFFESVGFGTGTDFDPGTGDATDQLLLNIPGVGLGAYALNSPFGPFAASSFSNFFDTGMTFGPLVLDDIGSATFQAVPEPATMLLLGSGLLGLAGFRKKFKK